MPSPPKPDSPTSSPSLEPAMVALAACNETLAKLDQMCCDSGRSPRMKALGETLDAAVGGLNDGLEDDSSAEETLTLLEDAGAQIGRLQVGCCAPKRMPLYADMLEGLTSAQLTINAEMGSGH